MVGCGRDRPCTNCVCVSSSSPHLQPSLSMSSCGTHCVSRSPMRGFGKSLPYTDLEGSKSWSSYCNWLLLAFLLQDRWTFIERHLTAEITVHLYALFQMLTCFLWYTVAINRCICTLLFDFMSLSNERKTPKLWKNKWSVMESVNCVNLCSMHLCKNIHCTFIFLLAHWRVFFVFHW